MTDEETIGHVLTLLGMPSGDWRLMRRNGKTFLALPPNREGARRAARLYQPQRFRAQVLMAIMGQMIISGIHRFLLSKLQYKESQGADTAKFGDVIPGSAGILLGSPEHRVRRAVASFRNGNKWEVAKVAFGDEGFAVLEKEAEALAVLAPIAEGVPRLLGIHHHNSATLLRVAYLTGTRVRKGDYKEPLSLLRTWRRHERAVPISGFPEWTAISQGLGELPMSARTLENLAMMELTPVVCHGDFARWNLLRQHDGKLVVLDWEWGHDNGMPGIDLVHFFLQDHRLIKRLPAADAIQATLRDLNRPDCQAYLCESGWRGNPLLPIIACLAWKQGAMHQENTDILKAGIAAYG